MEKVERHLRKQFGDRLKQALNRSLPFVVHAANFRAAQVVQLMNVSENENCMHMHTSRDESDFQLEESCSRGNAATPRMNKLVQDTHHVGQLM